jgi:hypothetical protein
MGDKTLIVHARFLISKDKDLPEATVMIEMKDQQEIDRIIGRKVNQTTVMIQNGILLSQFLIINHRKKNRQKLVIQTGSRT